MPELPDVAVYVAALKERIGDRTLNRVRIKSPSLLRTAQPPVSEVEGTTVRVIRRIGKRIAIGLDDDRWLVIHLMIAGRLQWRQPNAKLAARSSLAAFDFTEGTLVLTEAGTKRRASLHFVESGAGLEALERGGLDVFAADASAFRAALTERNNTLKRALTDPRILDGIGNAYSDEILHAAQLSPLAQTQKLTAEEFARLFESTRATLELWIDRLRTQAGDAFPEGVTAFRKDMAVHGRFGLPCPRCGEPVQRIRYAGNETNYCACCQTDGRLLADRSLSRLLKSDWPKTLEQLKARRSL